jgi:hypothetical protein
MGLKKGILQEIEEQQIKMVCQWKISELLGRLQNGTGEKEAWQTRKYVDGWD